MWVTPIHPHVFISLPDSFLGMSKKPGSSDLDTPAWNYKRLT